MIRLAILNGRDAVMTTKPLPKTWTPKTSELAPEHLQDDPFAVFTEWDEGVDREAFGQMPSTKPPGAEN